MNEIKKRESVSTKASNDGDIRSGASSQGAERNNEALMPVIIRSLKQEEKDINAVIMAASVICASLICCSGQDDLRAPRAKYLLDLLFSRVPQTNSPRVAVPIPHVPDPALAPSWSFGPSFGLLWANAYWITGLGFGLAAVFMAVLIKQAIRNYRVVIQRRGQSPKEKIRTQESLDGDAEAWYRSAPTDAVYRLFRVFLVLSLLAHVDCFVCPIGATTFIPTVICGLLYVFGDTRPTARTSISSPQDP
ncbi:hypothetical protein EDB92DRAFT_1831391 [Lactarius akahatsu]|uniref:DUF6535 domain-containing protein n=1 Tax=Lactarius akahatsu TaxID=416441 RepID=A0AAD4QCQ2_9AGAM|nr:hypothetical protein EDB92DRAFT_1831391 [Lactarius akahatsu]